MKKITIISLGWLGSHLHQELSKLEYDVTGSYFRTKSTLKNSFQYSYPNTKNEVIKQSDIIIFNLTPSAIIDIDKFNKFIKEYCNKRFIFISSTSVYSDQGEVNESTIPLPITNNGKLLLACEELLQKTYLDYTIIRSAGQYGVDRHPVNSLSGKVNLEHPNRPINMISLRDLTSLIVRVVNSKLNIPIINAVNNSHPSRQEFYTHAAKMNKLPSPLFLAATNESFKIVNTKYSEYRITSKFD